MASDVPWSTLPNLSVWSSRSPEPGKGLRGGRSPCQSAFPGTEARRSQRPAVGITLFFKIPNMPGLKGDVPQNVASVSGLLCTELGKAHQTSSTPWLPGPCADSVRCDIVMSCGQQPEDLLFP
ncbi:uncharacterized protein LOC116591467 isoform X3 [Mustela erminea]|uniref:uncharacterized protein LOC116591467 isoform X3 n=1 Tax=Mustela erminea TaxID=36723 RepID=UPI0013871E06|nr:uncharacterized protein LOC116591467 isoform X3 [Mustela erminea]